MTEGTLIASADAVPVDSTFLFRVRDVNDGAGAGLAANQGERESGEDSAVDEAILTRFADGVVGYLNRCMHFQHIRIDKGDGAPIRNGELVCSNHGAMFEEDTGLCTYGPCKGAVLETIETETRDGDVYLVDDDYEYVGDGPLESDPSDMASKSNIEF